MDELLQILQSNANETPENIAHMLGIPADEVRSRIADYEKKGIIRGYQAIVNEDALDLERVTAVIEVKVTPEREGGFDHIASRIGKFDEVSSMYLMSGTFDLLLFIVGRNLHEVAMFVSEKLSTMDGVVSTSTHFMLKTYKHHGLLMEHQDEYERLKVTP
jgi:DNA-binding Lrp family transcriptional regulator